MLSGSESSPFLWRLRRSTLAVGRTVGCSSRQFSGLQKRVLLGGVYPQVMETGTLFINDLVAGVMPVSLNLYKRPSTQMLKYQQSLLIARCCVQTLVLRVPRKKGGQTEQALGRSCGGFTTKVHLSLTDTGVPMRFILSAGQRHDATEASALIQGNLECAHVIGDRGYDSDAFIAAIQAQQAEAVIPPKKNRVVPRDYDKVLYKTRNLIERFIGHLKQYRRVSSRYDKLAVRYLGFLHFAAILIQYK